MNEIPQSTRLRAYVSTIADAAGRAGLLVCASARIFFALLNIMALPAPAGSLPRSGRYLEIQFIEFHVGRGGKRRSKRLLQNPLRLFCASNTK